MWTLRSFTNWVRATNNGFKTVGPVLVFTTEPARATHCKLVLMLDDARSIRAALNKWIAEQEAET